MRVWNTESSSPPILHGVPLRLPSYHGFPLGWHHSCKRRTGVSGVSQSSDIWPVASYHCMNRSAGSLFPSSSPRAGAACTASCRTGAPAYRLSGDGSRLPVSGTSLDLLDSSLICLRHRLPTILLAWSGCRGPS